LFTIKVFIFNSNREDVFHLIKRELLELHIPCLVWPERGFPQDDRDVWQMRYAKRRLNELLLKTGSKKQTRNWALSALSPGQKILIISIYETENLFGISYNTKGDNCAVLNGALEIKTSSKYFSDSDNFQSIADRIFEIFIKFQTEKVGKNNKVSDRLPDNIILLGGGQERFFVMFLMHMVRETLPV